MELDTIDKLARSFRLTCATGVLIMNSVFYGMMRSFELNVPPGVSQAEGLIIMSYAWVAESSLRYPSSRRGCIPWLALFSEFYTIAIYVFVAALYEAGTRSCSSYADTPIGAFKGALGFVSVENSCGMQTGIFTLATLTVFSSLTWWAFYLRLYRHHQREQLGG
ncbi:uncharacterized protein MAM_05482 [Metarhizium album ARSEF 1941]|uniref:MARVEL-like domain protein n=1 Tax=Metarhizium album (strain ARSEF 1941) TaxID=1081103 RepID=A0A0B2WSD4_METAS|nr:uncharacterized protein MAM_05482 [Metarhizium album ARSEF 1941]KHN96539.1 hypothetical protein MAM_05482 [Metarhizium album ARSEF 1941]